jgi:hypothetical protein
VAWQRNYFKHLTSKSTDLPHISDCIATIPARLEEDEYR